LEANKILCGFPLCGVFFEVSTISMYFHNFPSALKAETYFINLTTQSNVFVPPQNRKTVSIIAKQTMCTQIYLLSALRAQQAG